MMDLEKLIEAVKLCGSTPKVDQCKQWAYWSGGDMRKCIPRMTTEAATALSTLQAENKKLRAELEQVKRERDVAIEQLHGHCPACAHYTPNHNEGLCRFCCFEIAQDTNVEINDNWKWRGPKEG